jgi:hypothetical protein
MVLWTETFANSWPLENHCPCLLKINSIILLDLDSHFFGICTSIWYVEFNYESIWVGSTIFTVRMTDFTFIEALDVIEHRYWYSKYIWNLNDLFWRCLNTIVASLILDEKYSNEIILLNFLELEFICLEDLKLLNLLILFEGFLSLIMLVYFVMADTKYFTSLFLHLDFCFVAF